jgi:hypothetical protein
MPSDQLACPDTTEHAILRVLSGDPILATANTSGLDPDDLAAATEIYRTAGRQALAAHRDTAWRQILPAVP